MDIGGKGGNANSTEIIKNGHDMEFVTNPHKDGSNPNNNTNCGFDGENGESCGVVFIRGDLKVYAYGGKGGSGGNGKSSSGGGAGGYPAARNWWWTELVGGRR